MHFGFFISFMLVACAFSSSAAVLNLETLNAEITAKDVSSKLGNLVTVPVFVLNTKNAASFEVQVSNLSASNTIRIFKNIEILEMQPREVKSFNLYLQGFKPGIYAVLISLSSNNSIVAQKEFNFEVLANRKVASFFPRELNVSNCSAFTLTGLIQNKGSEAETLQVSLDEQVKTLRVNSMQSIPVTFQLTNIKALELNLVVSTEFNTTAHKIKLNTNCNQNTRKFSVSINNTQNYTLIGLFATVTGLPQGWIVSTASPQDLQPGMQASFNVVVTQTNDLLLEEVRPVLQITNSTGEVIYKQELPAIKPSKSPISGQFIKLLSTNLQLIAVLLIISLIVVLLFTRKK